MAQDEVSYIYCYRPQEPRPVEGAAGYGRLHTLSTKPAWRTTSSTQPLPARSAWRTVSSTRPPVISVQSVPSQVSAAQPAVVPQPAAHRASTPHDSRRAGLFGPRPLPSNVRRRATDDLKEHFSANSTVGGSYEESVSADEKEYSSVHASVGGSYNEPIGAGDMQRPNVSEWRTNVDLFTDQGREYARSDEIDTRTTHSLSQVVTQASLQDHDQHVTGSRADTTDTRPAYRSPMRTDSKQGSYSALSERDDVSRSESFKTSLSVRCYFESDARPKAQIMDRKSIYLLMTERCR